jgi:predicted TIM-barrel fold metal-dependent hydrolase
MHRGISADSIDRIVPFLSVHPADPDAADKVRVAAAEGFKGLKIHSYYQECDLDDPRIDDLYSAMEETRLLCVAHTGFDTAYPFVRKADPVRIVNVLRRHPRLRFVATHLGAWKDWDLVPRYLTGENIWVDTSFSLDFMSPDLARQLIHSFPPDRLLFGSDSPWEDQSKAIAQLKGLGLEPDLERAILSGNARRLLG